MVDFILFLLYTFIFVLGCCIGSFLNVIVYRVPNKISIADGRSFCPNCKEKIKSYDLIPILSYFFLGRKCRSCKQKISFRYPLIEAFVGAIAVLVFLNYYFNAKALLAFAFCAILVTIALIDFDTMEIPNSLIIAIIPIAILSYFIFPEINIFSRLIGFVAVSVPLYILTLAIPDCFGGGDIKLLAVCGFILGWKLILLATFLGIVIEGVYVITKMLLKKLKKGDHIAFGPALCLGIFISLLYGEQIIKFYLSTFNFYKKG